jgi:SecD/SecF fusion protein
MITPRPERIYGCGSRIGRQVIETTKAASASDEAEFATVAGGERTPRIESGEEIMPPGTDIKTYKDKIEGKDVDFKLLVKRRAELSGEHVKRAYAYFDQHGYGVSLSLDSEGAKIFGDLTQALAPSHGQIAIMLDGEIQSAPRVNEPIYGGSAVITGRFSDKEARDLASALENPLRVPVEVEEIRSVSPTLGTDSIRSGIFAGLTGLVLVFAFVMLYYRFAGIVAFFGLLVNIAILFGTMAMFNFVLTLPGIAGFILNMGIVDANVLIYEGCAGDGGWKSPPRHWSRARQSFCSAIFDANATTRSPPRSSSASDRLRQRLRRDTYA